MVNETYLRRLHNVIRVEAKDTSNANFFATHKPFTRLQYVPTTSVRSEMPFIHEDVFFKQVISQRDQHQFIIVQGHNGSGKSHLIRWMKEKYKRQVSEVDEAILFISRAQSTLRGALEQIIASGVFQNEETSEKLKKLVQANEHLSKEDLKYNILHQFAIAVQKDEDEIVKQVNLTSRERNQLYAFLMGTETQLLLMGPEGPIERIQKKLASEAKNEVMNEVSPFFKGEDFKVTYRDATKIKQSDTDRKALRFLESIAEASSSEPTQEVKQQREKLANYLNQFLDQVVQNCTQLRGTDLRDVFFQLRQELRKQGKNLTLFIEDITSFTGIDKALVDVLANTHEGNDFDASLCRIISLVGVTNAYYDSHFPSNFKNRVSGQLFVDAAAFGNLDDVCDLAARYLNAIYIEPEKLEQWVTQGASNAHLPISDTFSKHTWSMVKVAEHTMTLFPFNKRALGVFYHSLDEDERTPRRFLQRVISKYVQLYFQEGPDALPPDFRELSKTIQVPDWRSLSDDLELKRQADEKYVYRYISLFRVWGNGTIAHVKSGNRSTIGGLGEQVFQAFGLPLIKGIATTGGEDDNSPMEPDPAVGISTGTEIKRELSPKIEPSGSLTGGSTRPGAGTTGSAQSGSQPVENAQIRKYKALATELEQWALAKQELVNYERIIDDLLDFIREAVDWENEGVPSTFVSSYLTRRYVEIEGQYVKVQVSDRLTFQRSEKLRLALLGLVAWRELGNRNWEFPQELEKFVPPAHNYLLALLSWFESEKESIIAYIRSPKTVDRRSLTEWIVNAEFWNTVFTNGFKGNEKDAELIYLALANKGKKVQLDFSRSEAWQSVQNRVQSDQHRVDEHNEQFLRYFNMTQGDIIKSGLKTDVFFLDAYELLTTIERSIQHHWLYDSNLLPHRDRGDLPWYRSSNMLHGYKDIVKQAVESERNGTIKIASQVQSLLGEESVEELFSELNDFLSYLHTEQEPVDERKFGFRKEESFNPKSIQQHILTLRELEQVQGTGEIAILLSTNPAAPLKPYIEILINCNELVESTYSKYERKNNELRATLKQVNIDELRGQLIEEMDLLRDSVMHVVKEVSHASGTI